jgi:tryptophanyl-tRNA synthetase
MRVLSGIKPTGEMHLGNYLGALQHWAREQHEDAYYCVVDLHALTVPIDPVELRQLSLECAAGLFAVGLDPEVSTIFLQSHVPYHPRLSWLLECVASYGELQRMTQFKGKAGAQGGHRVGLFTYPVLMAADILLYDTNQVPVGDDQRQHLELARDLAERFNTRYGTTFTVPAAHVSGVGARIMDLQDPTAKMSKSEDSPLGTVGLFDDPADIDRKIRRAVTDTDGDVRHDRAHKPAVSNLLEIFGALTGEPPDAVAARYDQYGPLKSDLATAVIEALTPIRERYRAIIADPAEILRSLSAGTERATGVAAETYGRAAHAIGLLS